jgi:hypothetical protein
MVISDGSTIKRNYELCGKLVDTSNLQSETLSIVTTLHNPKFRKVDCFSCYLLQAGSSLSMYLDHEDGSNISFRNVCSF